MGIDRDRYIEAITAHESRDALLSEFDPAGNSVVYNADAVAVDPGAPDFHGMSTVLNDEELVRILFLLELHAESGYQLTPKSIELEHVYEAPGRPKKGMKGSRADVLVRDPSGRAFLYVELKTPEEYHSSRSLIEGQLFVSSRLETPMPRYLVWATVSEVNGLLKTQATVIDRALWPAYQDWGDAGEPAGNSIPLDFGNDIKRTYAKVREPGNGKLPLDRSCDAAFFNRLVGDLHDVLWGGGGTASNEVFATLTKLLLCKAFDEKETHDGDDYRFQSARVGDREESPDELMANMNALYVEASRAYLGLRPTSPAFDPSRMAPSKIAYAVRKLEGVSITRNDYDGDILGRFFEDIVSHGFTQTKGQFFTPQKLVDFMLELSDAPGRAVGVIRGLADERGSHRFPFVIDPSCGVGTFLDSYMANITAKLNNRTFTGTLSDKELETVEPAFAGRNHTSWAKTSLYGIESNTDLGLAAKVNMILHGDGSMNTFVCSGLLPFDRYRIEGRAQNVLCLRGESANSNCQFDAVYSNPPFSIKLTDDDKAQVRKAFSGELGLSEDLFIERWHQLLRPGGYFCCVLPESVLDTKREDKTRAWMIARFKIRAVVSLPYSAFQPYTSVKTCIVLAEKRGKDEADAISRRLREAGKLDCKTAGFVLGKAMGERVFMAEPGQIGYKRRKGLEDLPTPSDLPEVTRRFLDGDESEDPTLGFWVSLADVFSRAGIRLDPKYRWLWDKQHGKVRIGGGEEYAPLSTWVSLAKTRQLQKGNLQHEMRVVDLECVDGRTGRIEESRVPEVGSIGSDKLLFEGCDLLFSKLEPYLGKVVIDPPQDWAGTTEWVGLKCSPHSAARRTGHLLMLPEMLEAYRRLQSGKRHARLDMREVLQLYVNVSPLDVDDGDIAEINSLISEAERRIGELRSRRDDLYRG